MPEQPFLSKRQRGIINTYYANADGAVAQKMTELVSDIALAAGDEKKLSKLWAAAADGLARSSADPVRAGKIVAARDVESLARLAPTLKSAAKPKPDR